MGMKAGTLEIDFVTNLARIQGELTSIKRAVGQTMGDAVAQHNQVIRSSDALVASLEREAATFGKSAEQIRRMDVETKALAAEQAGLVDVAARIRGAYDTLTAAQQRQGNSLGFNRTQFIIAESATHRFIDSILAGQSPMKAFAMQAGDIGNVLAMDDGGVAGGLSKVRALLNPATLGIAALTAGLIVGVAAWVSYTNAIDKLAALSEGSGRVIGATGDMLEANAEAAAKSGNISISSARDIETAYVKMGGIGTGVLTGLTALTSRFAKATGQDAAGAEKELGAAFKDPSKGAEELATKYGTLTQAQIEHIQDLVQQNDLYGAQQALLAGLGPQFDKAADHANILARAWHGIETAAVDAWTSMGKAIDRAVGGGTLQQQLADLQQQRTLLLASNGNGAVGEIDKQIADIRAQLAQVNRDAGVAQARSQAVSAMKVVDGATGDNTLGDLKAKLAQVNGVLNDTQNKAGLSADQLTRARTAQAEYTHAIQTYLPEADRQVKLSQLDAQIAAATDPVRKAAFASRKSEIEQGGKLVTSAQASAIALAAGNKARAEASRSSDNHAATLAREAQAMEAQIRNTYALADAYGVSGAAALIAEARSKAESQAIKQKADVEAAVDRQVRLAVAQRIADAARSTASMSEQTDVQKKVNDEVAAGLIPAAQASNAVRDMIALLPLQAAAQAAASRGDAVGAQRAAAAIDAKRVAMKAANDEAARGQLIQASSQNNDEVARLQLESTLLAATNEQRAIALAQLEAEQHVRDTNQTGTQAGDDFIRSAVDRARAQAQLQTATDAYNIALDHQANLWAIIAENAQTAAQDMSTAFGHVGQSIGSLTAALTSYSAYQAQMAHDEQERLKNLTAGTQAYAHVQQEFATKSAIAQVRAYGDMADAAKGFFKEGTGGYKAMEDVEKAFRAVELALAIKSAAEQIGLIGTRTAATVAGNTAMAASDTARSAVEQGNSLATTAVKAVEAVINAIKSLPFPLNIAAGAATAAFVASFGVAIAGGGGSGNTLPAANEGKGTVFGDSSATSDSIKRSIDTLKDVDTLTMQYSAQMLTSLRSIEANIGGLTNILIRTGNINASAGVDTGTKVSGAFGVEKSISDAVGSVLGKIPIVGGILGGISSLVGKAISALFGTTTKVIGSGIYGGAQALGGIVDNGFDASYYSDVKKTHHFLGISTGSKYSTQYADASPEIEQQFTAILKGFYDAVGAAAAPLGLATDDVTKKLDAFVVNIGKIDLQGLNGQQIQDKLEAVFGAAADNIAQAAIPGLEKYQQVGEGYFETVTRVASTVETVTTELEKLGQTTKSLGIDASMSIAGFFDSLSDYTSASDAYFADYYTQAEQAAAKTAQLGKVFDSLGLTMPSTLADFRKLVESQDLTTAAGQQTYAELLKLAPAFADLQSSMNGAASAADILREKQDLQKQLLEAEGDTVALRALELQGLDASNRALQQQIWEVQDKQKVDQEAAGIQQQIWQLEGNTAALRAAELATLDPANRALQERLYALQDEQKIEQERANLQQQLYQLEGNTMALRALQLAQLDPSNRALQQQIYALQDAHAAADKAQQLSDAWKNVGQSIEDEIKRIRGLVDTPSQGYASLLSQFNAATAAANGGDQDAAKSLPELSKELLDTAANVATSRQELDRIQAETAAALQQVYDKIAATTAASDAASAAVQPPSTAPDAQSWWQTFATNQAATTSATTSANDKLVSAVQGLRSDIASLSSDQRTGHAVIAANTGKMARVLDNVSRPTGGNAIATEAAA